MKTCLLMSNFSFLIISPKNIFFSQKFSKVARSAITSFRVLIAKFMCKNIKKDVKTFNVKFFIFPPHKIIASTPS